jgi:hypothetical protein
LLSWIVLGLLVAVALLIPLGIGDPGSLLSIVVAEGGLVCCAALNRMGVVTGAGTLLVALLVVSVAAALLTFPLGLSVDTLPAYDLLVAGVVAAATVLPRQATFLVAGFNIAFIVGDFYLQPHYANLDEVLHDTHLYPSPLVATASLLGRPIALQILVAVVAYLWVRGTDEAIRRADRAEEIASLEHVIADQKRQLDMGIQQILQTHVRAANGDFGARAPTNQENVLWQIASSLNNLLARLQRAGQAEHQLHRTEEELRRLASALDDAQSGRPPLWPAPSGTAADLIIDRLARLARRSGPSTPRDTAFGSGFGSMGQLGPTPSTPGARGWPGTPSMPGARSQTSTPLGPYGPPQGASHGASQGGLPSGDAWWQAPTQPPSTGMPGAPDPSPANPWTTLQESPGYEPHPYAPQYPPEP